MLPVPSSSLQDTFFNRLGPSRKLHHPGLTAVRPGIMWPDTGSLAIFPLVVNLELTEPS